MDQRKKSRMHKRKSKFQVKKRSDSSISSDSEYGSVIQSSGVALLTLSPLTQKIVGCELGTDLTEENPWIYVRKDLIEDNIDLHEKSSEFLAIRSRLLQYPDSEILIGYKCDNKEADDKFYVVLTLDDKRNVLQMLKEKEKNRRQKAERAVIRPVKNWFSLGSEKEIDLYNINKLRPLRQVEVESKNETKEIHWSFRRAEDARDGYIELLPDPRYTQEYVQRRRVDKITQIAPRKVTEEVQTQQTYPKNQHTQCEVLALYGEENDEDTAEDIPEEIKKNVGKFLQLRVDALEELILFNKSVNLYEDDYAELKRISKFKKEDQKVYRQNFNYVCSFIDRITTEDLIIVDSAWNPYVSGIVAVCYNDISVTFTGHNTRPPSEPKSCEDDVCPVLVWSYTSEMHPLLYLECPRPVCALHFSPFHKNLLAGGTINGQVIIWDLTGKIEEVETPDLLTEAQRKHRTNIAELMAWMMNIDSKEKVKPKYVSHVQSSHTDRITDLGFVYPGAKINEYGDYTTSENANSCQFYSVGLDGMISVWDLQRGSTNIQMTIKKKVRHSCTVFAEVEHTIILRPVFTFFAIDNDNKVVPLNKIQGKRFSVDFAPVSEVSSDPKKRIYYEMCGRQSCFTGSVLLLTSLLGTLEQVGWQGRKSGSSKTIKNFQISHDGPVLVCCVNKFITDCVLTIGGKYFAIWRFAEVNDVPLFRRKACSGIYLSGGWNDYHPLLLLVLRSDGVVEWWNFLADVHRPSRTMSISGDRITKFLGHFTSLHSRRHALALVDIFGAMDILILPHSVTPCTREELEKSKIMFNKLAEYMLWFKEFEAKISESCQVEIQKSVKNIAAAKSLIKLQVTPSLIPEKKTAWCADRELTTPDEKWGLEQLLKQKNLNLAEMQKYTDVLDKDLNEKSIKCKKVCNLAPKAKKRFHKKKAEIYQQFKETTTKFSTNYAKLSALAARDSTLLRNYEEIESDALEYISMHHYGYDISWDYTLHCARSVKESADYFLSRSTVFSRTSCY